MVVSKCFFFSTFLRPVTGISWRMMVQNCSLNVSSAVSDTAVLDHCINVGYMFSESNGTASTQRSESECSGIQHAWPFCPPEPKQLRLLFVHRGVWVGLRSESYGIASIQRSESGYPSTQLAAILVGFESNGMSTQHSELD